MHMVALEDLEDALRVIEEFNRLDLRDVTLTRNGEPFPLCPDVIEEFRFIGLSNKNFVSEQVYQCWGTMWVPRNESE